MTDFAQARKQMIDGQLQTSGVFARKVLAAMSGVPREYFVPEQYRQLAYLDRDQPLGNNRYLASPAAMAKLIDLADISPDDIVLDVACGTGYSTAVISHVANAVVALESDSVLAEKANENLLELDISNAAVVHGPMDRGVASESPFDVITIQGAVEAVPPRLLDQLREDGRLVAVIGSGASAQATRFVKTSSGISPVPLSNVHMPLLDQLTPKKEFRL